MAGGRDLVRGLAATTAGVALAAVAAAVALGLTAAPVPGVSAAAGSGGGADGGALRAAWTGRQAELRETIPVARRKLAEPRSVLALRLPRLRPGDRVRFNAEVTATTTCVEAIARCIGRPYRFDPRIGARVVLARRARAARRGTLALTGRAALACEQTRPNRNHHCPLVLEGVFDVPDRRALPCPPERCRLNVLLDSHHRRARGGEVVVVGADRPDGSVDGGKARLAAAVTRGGAGSASYTTRERRARSLPAHGRPRVVLSRRLAGLERGDVLLVRARQRTRIRGLPYFVAAKVVLAGRPGATKPGRSVRRLVSRAGTATETNGFNCTDGPSAFRSPCLTRKAGLARVKRAPRARPLYANLVLRSFPKRAQARGGYPPARVLRRGRLEVTRLRAPGD